LNPACNFFTDCIIDVKAQVDRVNLRRLYKEGINVAAMLSLKMIKGLVLADVSCAGAVT